MEIKEIEARFKGHTAKRITDNRRGFFSVLIPLIKGDEGPLLLFEERSSQIEQGGDVSFPGGKVEEGETGEEAAVREACEELLINPEQVEIICPMHLTMGPGGAEVTSYLGVIKDYQDTFSRDEVARTFAVPLQWFLDHPPVVHVAEAYTVLDEDFPYDLIKGGKNYDWKTFKRNILFYKTSEGVIWGFTAMLVYHFLKEYREYTGENGWDDSAE